MLNGVLKSFKVITVGFSLMFLSFVFINCDGGGGGDSTDNSDTGNTGTEYVRITNISPSEGTDIDRGSDLRNDVDFSVTIEWSFEGSAAEITGAWVWDGGSYTPVCHDESGQDYWNPNDCFDDILVNNNNGTMTYSWTNHNWIGYPAIMTFQIYMWTANGLRTDNVTYY